MSARLLVIEMVIPGDTKPYLGTIFDLEMRVLFQGGRERTEAEFRRLYAAAGFKLTRTLPTASFSFVIEGLPA